MPWDAYLSNFTTELVPKTVSLEFAQLEYLVSNWADWGVNVELV